MVVSKEYSHRAPDSRAGSTAHLARNSLYGSCTLLLPSLVATGRPQ